MTASQNTLLGAMVGLVRAVDKNRKTPETDVLLLSALEVLSTEENVPEDIMLRIREEKVKAAPGCALCAMPCGSTADADMEAVWRGDPEVTAVKGDILRTLYVAIPKLKEELQNNRTDSPVLFLLHKGLFVLAEDQSPEELQQTLSELKMI